MTVTFFGHSDIPQSVLPVLEKAIKTLIIDEGVTRFYVGNNGAFDLTVYKCLSKFIKVYKNLSYNIVLAYMPTSKNQYNI